MEELIKQAFMQVDVLGPHVMEGHYDLMGPDGEIILPSVWENVIQPDMAITMAMWPMDNYPPPPAPESHRTVGPSPKKKPVRRSGKDSGPSMAEYIFGKPGKRKKAGASSSADQQNQEEVI